MANAALTYEGVKDKYCGCQCADPEQHLCGDVCVYKNDPNNCGRCNKVVRLTPFPFPIPLPTLYSAPPAA